MTVAKKVSTTPQTADSLLEKARRSIPGRLSWGPDGAFFDLGAVAKALAQSRMWSHIINLNQSFALAVRLGFAPAILPEAYPLRDT